MNDNKKSNMSVQELQKQLEELRNELKHIKEDYVLVKKYWFEDEEGNKWYDTDEMESEFHDTMVDLGAYQEECEEEE